MLIGYHLSLHFILLVAYFYSLQIIDRKNNHSFNWRKKNMYIYKESN